MEIIKDKTLAEKREAVKKQTPAYYLQSNKSANMHLLQREIMRGLKPKWYAVIHFNDAGNSKRQHKRRLDDAEVEKDLEDIKANFIQKSTVENGRRKPVDPRASGELNMAKAKSNHISILLLKSCRIPTTLTEVFYPPRSIAATQMQMHMEKICKLATSRYR